MSNVVPFDTLALALALREEAGFDQRQAEGTARVLSRLLVADLVTKADLVPLATKADLTEIKADLVAIKADIAPLAAKADVAAIKADLELRIADVRADLLKTIIGATAFNSTLVLGAMFGLAKLLGH